MSYDAQATRDAIFAAATAEFAEHGLAGARVERIAARAQSNKQAIYLYYGSKEKLFDAVLRVKVDEICHAVRFDPSAVADSVGRLFDWYQAHPELIRLLLWEALERGAGAVGNNGARLASSQAGIAPLRGETSTVPEQEREQAAQEYAFTLIGLAAWGFAVPQLRRIILDESDEERAVARTRAAAIAAAAKLDR